MSDPKRAAKAYGRFGKTEKPGKEGNAEKDKGQSHSDENSSLQGFLKKGITGNPYRKAAKLLLLLGKEQAARVLSHFSTDEIEKITREIAGIKRIDKEEAKLLLDQFGKAEDKVKAVSGGLDVARSILEKAFGRDKGDALLEKVIPFGGQKPFSFLEEIESQQIFLLLRRESAAVIAIVLSFLSRKKSGEIVKMLSPSLQVETVRRLGRMERVSPSVVASIEMKLQERLHAQGQVITEEVDGQAVLASILKQMNFREGERILDTLGEGDVALKEQISKRLFTVEDLLRISDRDMQRVLRDFEDREIALLMKEQNDAVKEKFFSCISDRRKLFVQSELEISGPLRRDEVDKARNDFLAYVRGLVERGEIVLSDEHNPLV
ncbi:flagellar motor switch protein FliG [Sediminispirochaeta bajacaliforniensis]|uniref:flagellar motor switch protein FliG n=1 Tax=Sediminispirochaeta bajacaliforniensis TaxID=148 RepID=UPI00037BEA77|nr:FliG C-terminal domain-containing protein [Sediminispirochaeta bajacaliforniensis]